MRRAVLTGTVILLMGFCMSARADLVPVNVDGLTFHASTADEKHSANNWFNEATSWIEDDSGSSMTAIMSADDKAVGLALNGASAVHTGEGAYWGGIVSFKSLQYTWKGSDGSKSGSSGFNSEVTAAFWGLKFGAIEAVNGITNVYNSGGVYNIQFNGSNTATFKIYFTGGEFKVSYEHPGGDFPGSAPALNPGTGTGQVDLKDASQVNAVWNTATGGDFLLSGNLNADNFSYNQNSYSAVATITLVNLNTVCPSVSTSQSGLMDPSEFTKTGGDLASLVNPFHNPDSIEKLLNIDGYFQITNFGVTYGLQQNGKPASWVGDGGSAYLAPTLQGPGDAAEFMDDTLIRVQLQTPEVSAILYLAPTVFGFLGFSIRRRRKTS